MYDFSKKTGEQIGKCLAISTLIYSIPFIPIYVTPSVRIFNRDGKMYGVYHSLRTRIFKKIST